MPATLLAFLAIVSWASLATIGKFLTHLPTFYVLGITFLIGGSPAFFQKRAWQVPWATFGLGIFGLFGYHFFLFSAYRLITPLEATLVNYLWPMLLVFFSAWLLPGMSLRKWHFIGGILALGGIMLLGSGQDFSFNASAKIGGFLLAASAAITWALYSVLLKKVAPFPVITTGAFCLLSGALCLLVHSLLESKAEPTTQDVWWLLAMGFLPMGFSFYAWDKALKKGNPQIIGALSYCTPLLSTLSLVLWANETMSLLRALALLLILGGALVTAKA